MNMKFREAADFKSSGLEWHSRMPSDWELTQLKRVSQVKSSKRVFEEQYKEIGVPFYRSKEIVELANNRDISVDLYISEALFEEYKSKSGAPKNGDLLITSIGTIGEVWVCDGREFYFKDGNITQLISGERLKPNFIKYCFQSNFFKEQYRLMSDGSTLMALSIEKINRLFLLLPSLKEQEQIVSYLDIKTNEIDALISCKEQFTILLEEKRQAMITEAVTKGLNPNVKMKDSGVQWIGDIPEHWEFNNIKHIADIHSSNVDKKSVDGEQQVLLCNYVDVYYNDEITKGLDFMEATAKKEQIEKFTLQEDDVIITKDSESPIDIAIPTWVSENLPGVLCGYHLALIRSNKKQLNGLFLYYCLESEAIREQFYSKANGVTRFGLLKDAIKNGIITSPPLEEQKEIASYLYEMNKHIRNIKADIKTQIQKLKEYRQSLIYEAVTGKIDVRNFEEEE